MSLDFHGSSVRAARHHLLADLNKKHWPVSRAEDARLVLSELMGNSLRHARPLPDGQISVGWREHAGLLRVTVTDGGSLTRPRERHAGEMSTEGRGLTIVQSLARRWGVESGNTTTTVWAEVDVR